LQSPSAREQERLSFVKTKLFSDFTSQPDELTSKMIVGKSWRERVLGLCIAMAKNPASFVKPMAESLNDVRRISVVPTCAALAVLARRGLVDLTATFTNTMDHSAFDGEVGWAIDKAIHFAGIRPDVVNEKGPNYGQVFEDQTEMCLWI
jgi:hypothetical protein